MAAPSAHSRISIRLPRSRVLLRTTSLDLEEVLQEVLPPGACRPGLWTGPDAADLLEVPVLLEGFLAPLRRRRVGIRQGSPQDGAWRRGETSLWFAEGLGFREIRVGIHQGSPEIARAAARQFLRTCLPEWTLYQGGIVLHGATLVDGPRSVVFVAPSGGGKTTLARDFGANGCLGDDAAFLWPDPTDGRWWAWPSPLPGREGVPVTGQPAPLEAVVRLRKGLAGPASAIPLPGHAALREVLARVRVDARIPAVRACLLDRVLALVGSVPVISMALPRHQAPGPLLAEALGAPSKRDPP